MKVKGLLQIHHVLLHDAEEIALIRCVATGIKDEALYAQTPEFVHRRRLSREFTTYTVGVADTTNTMLRVLPSQSPIMSPTRVVRMFILRVVQVSHESVWLMLPARRTVSVA